MKKAQADLLQGTLDLLVLKTLQSGPAHGWDIAQRRIASEWGASENNRKAKYYKLTAAGRKQLTAETETWEPFA
ncbi:MAG TPA: PadR family transcriptional regulator, partial [Blastocatellia bacterium]|nr:PadR family transcriptional regulator [Blastocatellia bacterium]